VDKGLELLKDDPSGVLNNMVNGEVVAFPSVVMDECVNASVAAPTCTCQPTPVWMMVFDVLCDMCANKECHGEMRDVMNRSTDAMATLTMDGVT